MNSSQQSHLEAEDQIDIIALISKVWAGRKFIIKSAAIAGVFGVLVAILTPNTFTASSMFTPNSSGSSSGGLVNPTIFAWDKGKKAKYYIKKSGGTKKRIESMVVLQANGKSEKIGLFKNPKIYPGAQIIITEKPEKINDGKSKFLDDFVRIFGVVTGALTTIILTKNL